MKTLLVTLHNTFAIRNLLRTQALGLVQKSGVHVVCLAPAEKIEYYRQEFTDYTFEPLPIEVRDRPLDKFFQILAVQGLHSRTVQIQSFGRMFRPDAKLFHYVRNAGTFIFERLVWHLGRFAWWRPFVRWLYHRIPSRVYQELFNKYQPDLVFAANMINPEDYRLVLEAKRRGIKTVGMVLSWDNLTSKVFLQAFPDQLIVHNNVIKDEAIKLAGYPAKNIVVTGVPQYDPYFKHQGVLSRVEFCERIGADPAKKIILYAASGKASILFDLDIVEGLTKAIESGRIKQASQILVRPYPRYDFPPAKIEELRRRANVLTASPVTHGGWKKDNWEFGDADLGFLISSLAHADVVLTMTSTFLIEGTVFDKPVISPIFNGQKKLNYWYRAERFMEFDHLNDLKDFGAFAIARSAEELYDLVNEALENPKKHHDRRQALVLRQAVYTDGRSAERLGQFLLDQVASA